MVVVLIWYLKRDKKIKGLSVIEGAAIGIGVAYNAYKILNFSVAEYGMNMFGKTLKIFFSDSAISSSFCVLACVVFIIAFAFISKRYEAFFSDEEDERKRLLSLRKTTKDIYKPEGYGIDTVEDDFILTNS